MIQRQSQSPKPRGRSSPQARRSPQARKSPQARRRQSRSALSSSSTAKQSTAVLETLRKASAGVMSLYEQAQPLIEKLTQGQTLTKGEIAELQEKEQTYESSLTKFLGALQRVSAQADKMRPPQRKGFVNSALNIAKPVTDLMDQGCSMLRGVAWVPFVPEPWKGRLKTGRDICNRLGSTVQSVRATLQ